LNQRVKSGDIKKNISAHSSLQKPFKLISHGTYNNKIQLKPLLNSTKIVTTHFGFEIRAGYCSFGHSDNWLEKNT